MSFEPGDSCLLKKLWQGFRLVELWQGNRLGEKGTTDLARSSIFQVAFVFHELKYHSVNSCEVLWIKFKKHDSSMEIDAPIWNDVRIGVPIGSHSHLPLTPSWSSHIVLHTFDKHCWPLGFVSLHIHVHTCTQTLMIPHVQFICAYLLLYFQLVPVYMFKY